MTTDQITQPIDGETPPTNPSEYYKFMAQGLDESFADMKVMHANREKMEKHPVGTPEHHIAGAKMAAAIANHSRGMASEYASKGDSDNHQRHTEIMKRANVAALDHLSKFHFSKANQHAENGRISDAIVSQLRGQEHAEERDKLQSNIR